MIGIYKIINPNDRIYIGQSVDIDKRWDDYRNLKNVSNQKKLYRSLKKYGIEQHKFEYKEGCLLEDLNERERYWQDHYDVLNGGLNCKLTKTNDKSGKDSEDTIRNRVEKNNKPVLQYDLEGNFMKEWFSVVEPKNLLKINHITANLKNRQNQSGGFVWRYKTSQDIPQKIEVNLRSKLKRTIIQYTKDKQFIREWDHIKQASDELGIGDLNSCLIGRTKTAGGFIWKYKEEQDQINEVNLDHKFNKPVIQYDLKGNIINKFKSKTEAELNTGIKSLYYNLKTNNPRDGSIFKYE